LGPLAVALLVLGFAQAALGDASDVKFKPEAPLPTALAKVEPSGHVVVEVIGGWVWSTHEKMGKRNNCNEDRAGVGVAIDWFDPHDEGFELGAEVEIEKIKTKIFVGSVGNALNPEDNVVHPTENDTGKGEVVDVKKPSEFAKWRGGCGVFSTDKFFANSKAAEKGELTEATVSHGNFGHVTPGESDLEGNPFNNPTPPSESQLQGAVLRHVYESIKDVEKIHICAVTYDVHPQMATMGKSGTAASENNGVGIPNKESEVTAGGTMHNMDNGVQGNENTPAGNSCPTIPLKFQPEISTTVKEVLGKTVSNASPARLGAEVQDTATLSGEVEGFSLGGAKVTYNFYKNNKCEGAPASSEEVTVESSGAVPASKFTAALEAGEYSYKANYGGNTNYKNAEGTCEPFKVQQAQPEISTIVKSKAGATVTNAEPAPLGTEVQDTAKLSGEVKGFSLGGAKVTYNFYKNNKCEAPPASSEEVTVESSGAVPASKFTAALEAGEYSYKANYGGNTNYKTAEGTCEPFKIQQAQPEISTIVKSKAGATVTNAEPAPLGTEVQDTAKLSGEVKGFSLGGAKVTYNFYKNNKCEGAPTSSEEVTVEASGAVPASKFTAPLEAGEYSYKANYGGNTNYKNAEGTCEPFKIVSASFTIKKLQEIEGSKAGFTEKELTGKVGQTVLYEIVVKNTGETRLTFSNFEDSKCEGIVEPATKTLEPTESTTYTCKHVLTKADEEVGKHENEATVTGTPPPGQGKPITHTSNVVVVNVPEVASFTIKKFQEIEGTGTGFTENELTGKVGQTVLYKIVVKNTGETRLTFSNFEDLKCETIVEPANKTLEPEESTTYTCKHVLTKADQEAKVHENVATVTGTTPKGKAITEKSNTVVVKLSQPPVCPNAFTGGAGINLGGAGNYAVLGLKGTRINNSIVTVEGNEGVSEGGQLANNSPSVITGNVFEFQKGQYFGTGTVGGSIIVAPATLNENDAQAIAASKAAAALAPTQTFGTIAANTTIVGTSGVNVILIKGNLEASLTLKGTASSVFIVNITGSYGMFGKSTLGLEGGVTANNVLYNFIGASGAVNTKRGSLAFGSLLGVNYVFNLSGTVHGEVIGGGSAIELTSGAIVTCN
jgi:hypothetical protein